jgi:hypothetical protein
MYKAHLDISWKMRNKLYVIIIIIMKKFESQNEIEN